MQFDYTYFFQYNQMSSKEECHERSRGKVCGACLRKPKHYQKISTQVLILIQKHCFTDYNLQDISLPLIICKSCVKSLTVIDGGATNRKVPSVDYEGLVKPKAITTRATVSEKCYCSICEIARMNGPEYLQYERRMRDKPGRPSQ